MDLYYHEPYKKHDMEHDLVGYKDTMCNSQKPAPNDPDKKQGNDSTADYTGKANSSDMDY